jgi:NADPH:quinone reductase-like Zn-dependent oxidoreductase
MMNAITIDQFGGEETMKYQTRPVPEAGKGEILLKVETAGVGVWDPMERAGLFAKMYGLKPPFPHVLGSDGAGTVVAVGEGVTRFKTGDRVYGMSLSSPKGGFYAEYAVIREEQAALVPKQLSVEEAGVLTVDAVTGMRGLDDTLKLKEGESIVIIGASGGIGHLAVQFAKRMGARVLAVASGEDGVALAKRLGADATVDRHADVLAVARQFAPDGIDTALVTAGGESVDKALTALKKGGRVAYPNGVNPPPKAPAGVTAQNYNGETDRAILEKISRLIEAGPFHVNIARTFPLAQAVDAMHMLGTHYLGKIALRP